MVPSVLCEENEGERQEGFSIHIYPRLLKRPAVTAMATIEIDLNSPIPPRKAFKNTD